MVDDYEEGDLNDNSTTPITELTPESAEQIYRFLNGMYDGLKTITDLNNDERRLLLRLDLMLRLRKGVKLDTEALGEFKENYLRYTISKNRKGRTEVINAISGRQAAAKKRGSLFHRRY